MKDLKTINCENKAKEANQQAESETRFEEYETHFQARRRSLKTIAAGVAAPFAPLIFAGTAVENAPNEIAPEAPTLPAANKRRTHDLELHVFSSTAVTEDSVLLRNNLEETMVLREIKPSIIVFKDRFIDLRRIIRPDSELSLAPLHTVSFQVVSQPLYGREWSQRNTGGDQVLPDVIEYLWAQECVSDISANCVLVSTAAFIADKTALLYAKPEQLLASGVQASGIQIS